MNFEGPIGWIAIGAAAFVLGWIVKTYLSPEAKLERRRRRNNRRVVSSARRPTVKFGVRTGKKRRP